MEYKTDAVYNMLYDLIINKNVQIDGIGFQCHLYVSNYVDIMSSQQRVLSNLQRFGDLGLEIHISEVSCFLQIYT